MNLLNFALNFGLILGSISASSSSTSSSSSSSTSSSSTSSLTSTIHSSPSSHTESLTMATSIALPSAIINLPPQSYKINKERPLMINQINNQRKGMRHPLLCQDSLLTSIAQQHANNMAALDMLDHDLPCSSTAYPVQFCKSKNRLEPFGQAAENILSLAGNDGSATEAMGKFNANASDFANMMNPDYLYVGLGMAMNKVSGKYYWVQVFSTGNYQGVSCTLEPSVTVLDAYNRTSTTVQPFTHIDIDNYPQGITDNHKQGLYCTMIPFAHGTGKSALPLGQLPYPTITLVPENHHESLKKQVTGIIGAFAEVLSKANATIVGPSSLKLIPMEVKPTGSHHHHHHSHSHSTNHTTTFSINPASMMATFSPTNSEQSSVKSAMSSMLANPSISSMMADPTMSSAAIQMAQFMMMASSTSSHSASSKTGTVMPTSSTKK